MFNAEEHGLVGSKAYARQQKLMNAPIIAVFQMDMVGYNRLLPRAWELHAGYSASQDVEQRSLLLAKLLQRVSAVVAPQLDAPQVYTSATPEGDPAERRSDHASFHACGYAACVASEDFFGGPEPASPAAEANPNYHKKDDTFIDGDFAADIARVLAAGAWVTAKASSCARFRKPVHRPRSIIHAPRGRYAPYQCPVRLSRTEPSTRFCKPVAGKLFVCDATLWSSAFGGLGSLQNLWRNLARLPL